MSLLRTIPRLSQQCIRQIATTQVVRDEVVDTTKLKENQRRFQVDDGKPVYLKGGVIDNVLFQVTVGLCVIGLGMTAQFFYEYAFPKK